MRMELRVFLFYLLLWSFRAGCSFSYSIEIIYNGLGKLEGGPGGQFQQEGIFSTEITIANTNNQPHRFGLRTSYGHYMVTPPELLYRELFGPASRWQVLLSC
jgi:hypothetical protein